MKTTSKLSPKAYISALKQRMGSHFDLGQERFTGFFLGPLFTVTHHSYFEWNRRVTNEKSTALGFVKKTPEGSRICCICLRGMLAPTQFFLWFIILWLLTSLLLLMKDLPAWGWGLSALICFAAMVIAAPISAFAESLTEKGQEGMRCLTALLLDPENPSY